MVRVLVERGRVALVTANDGGAVGGGDRGSEHDYDYGSGYGDSFVSKMSYLKLPETWLELSVLKLDGSRFDVHVARNATIAELQQAVEEVFTLSPKEGQGKISWSHVWGHFCLCYDGQKLVNDRARVRDFGIKDGDELQFVRHLSINSFHLKRQSKPRMVASKQDSRSSSRLNAHEEKKRSALADKYNLENQEVSSSSGSDAHEEKEHAGLADKDSLRDQDDSNKYFSYEEADDMPPPDFKLAHFLRGWLSYSRLWVVSRKKSEGKSRPSRFSLHRLGCASRVVQL